MSTARERELDPTGWRLSAEVRAGLTQVISARRDVRRFRAEAVPDDLLRRVLEAGHAAPSVGHSQPWRFLIVRSADTRAAAAVLADRERLRQAAGMTEEAARQLLSLRLEGLREAPVGVVVCCDRRTRAAGVLGRATFPDSDVWSCVAAVQNMWLTARAEGLGMGWVTLFRPEDLAGLLGLPDGVRTVGWLCLGWPDERPPAPGLERAGWSRRRPLDEVVIEERWPEPAGEPSPPPDHATARPDPVAAARVRARDRDDTLLAVPGALGLLGDVLADLAGPATRDAGAPGGISGGISGGADGGVDGSAGGSADGGVLAGGTLVVAAADHPVTAHGVSAYPAETTAILARALASRQGLGAVAAVNAGLEMLLVDAGVDGPPLAGWRDERPRERRGDLVGADALAETDAARLLAAGEAIGTALARCGPVVLGEIGIGNTTVAAALAAALTGAPVDTLVGRGAGSDSAGIARKQAVVTGALARAGYGAGVSKLERDELVQLLCALGGGEVCLLTGVVLGGADAGATVVLDGMLTGVAALAALRHRPPVRSALVAGHRSAEPGHALVLRELGVEPLLDLRLRAGEGIGAALAVGLLRHGERVRADGARTA